MLTTDVPPGGGESPPRAGRWPALLVLTLALIAGLVLRLAAIDGYLTVDEPRWEERSLSFGAALRDGDLASTYQSEHPGVTVMWIGVAADKLADWAERAPEQVLGIDIPHRLLHPLEPGIPSLTFWARRLSALITWLASLLLAWLVSRLWGRRAAAAALILIVLQPFYLALSRVHHLDALLAAFCALCVASWLLALRAERPYGWAALAGLTGALAILTKLPGLVLVPWAGLTAIVAWLTVPKGERRRRLGTIVLCLGIAGAVLGATMLLVWPALRVAAKATLEQVYAGFNRQAWNPHENLNFFMGQKVADPGTWFYAVAWLFRSTPLVGLGLVALVIARRHVSGWRDLVRLLLFVLLYGLSLTAASKKFDRYLMPVFPLVDIVAGVGWAALGVWLAERLSGRWRRAVAAPLLLFALMAVGQLAALLPVASQPLAYYNPLLGNGPVAAETLFYGWGEGLGDAARWLNTLEDAENLHVATHSPNEFSPFFVGHTTLLGSANPLEPDYFILYASHLQREFIPEVIEQFEDAEPLHTVRVAGLEYAWIYANDFWEKEIQNLLRQIEAQYQDGDLVLVPGDPAFIDQYDGPMRLLSVAGPAREDYMASLLNGAGQRTSRIWLIGLPGLHDEQQAMLFALLDSQGQVACSLASGDLGAVRFNLRPMARFVSPRPAVRREYLLGESIVLRGYDLDLTQCVPGGSLSVRLYWFAAREVQDRYKVFTHLVGPDGQMIAQLDAEPQGYALPTSEWRLGWRIVDDYQLHLPGDAPLGVYELSIGMYSVDSLERLGLTPLRGEDEILDHVVIEGIVIE